MLTNEQFYDYEEDLDIIPQNQESKILFQNNFVGYKNQFALLERIYYSIHEISQEFGISEGVSFLLLNMNFWILEKTRQYINDYFTFPEYEIVKDQDYCPICCEEFGENPKELLICGHCFCFDCFGSYIKESVKEGPSCILKTCPDSNCKELLGPSIFRKYLFEKHKNDFLRFEKYLVDNLVISSHSLKWCPGKNCKQAIDLEASKIFKFSQKNIKCECGCSFCLACEKEAHMPSKCEQFSNWLNLAMGKNNKVDELWMKIHTKKCPQCKVNIEKNLGCMHMTCKNCRYEFCWLCLGDWKALHGPATGGFYNCNIYKEDENLNKELTENEREINRFNFYMDRYQQHQASLRKAEEKKKEKLEEFVNLQNNIKTQEDEKMVAEALDLIVECRRCISYTYVIAYYLGAEKKEFFQFLQAELERNLEILDELTDENFGKLFQSSKKYVEWKNKSKNLKEVLKSYSENILSDLEKNLPDLKVEKKKSLHTGKSLSFLNSKEKDEHWYCLSCTYANTQDKLNCDMCARKRNDA